MPVPTPVATTTSIDPSAAPLAAQSLPPGLPDRRAMRRAQTEGALREAALDLAEERGFDGFTVDEVAHRAGVSPRTFFNYFATKEAAVLADSRPVLEAMNAALAEHADAPLVDAVRAAVKAFLAVSTSNPRAMRRELLLIESQLPLRVALLSHYCAYERTLGRGIADRLGTTVEADPLPLVLAAAAVAVARIVLVQWSWTADEAPDPAAVEETLARMGALLAP